MLSALRQPCVRLVPARLQVSPSRRISTLCPPCVRLVSAVWPPWVCFGGASKPHPPARSLSGVVRHAFVSVSTGPLKPWPLDFVRSWPAVGQGHGVIKQNGHMEDTWQTDGGQAPRTVRALGRANGGHIQNTSKREGGRPTHAGHMADKRRTRSGQSVETRPKRSGHMADMLRGRARSWPAVFFLRENPTVNCLGNDASLNRPPSSPGRTQWNLPIQSPARKHHNTFHVKSIKANRFQKLRKKNPLNLGMLRTPKRHRLGFPLTPIR